MHLCAGYFVSAITGEEQKLKELTKRDNRYLTPLLQLCHPEGGRGRVTRPLVALLNTYAPLLHDDASTRLQVLDHYLLLLQSQSSSFPFRVVVPFRIPPF